MDIDVTSVFLPRQVSLNQRKRKKIKNIKQEKDRQKKLIYSKKYPKPDCHVYKPMMYCNRFKRNKQVSKDVVTKIGQDN